MTVAFAAHAQRWYEVTDYMVGPLSSQLLNTVIVNGEVWEGLPSDIQQILLEEGARHELDSIRVTPAWNEVWIQRNIDAGLEYQEFSDDLMDHMRNVVATEHVVPGFISRQDEDNRDNIIALFNEKIAPIVGAEGPARRLHGKGSDHGVDAQTGKREAPAEIARRGFWGDCT